MNRIVKTIAGAATLESGQLRNFTASAKLTQEEFAQLEQRAARAGKRVGEWCREVFLRELGRHELPDILLAEVLAVRMIVLNILAPVLRGEKFTIEEFQKLIAHADTTKMKRALEKLREPSASAQLGGK
jgi:hypothetical protein